MKLSKFLTSVALGVGVALVSTGALAADVTVRMLHVDQNPDVQAFYADIARRFEATHAGVKVDVQYLENQAYKSKLTTLLQSPERPNILYSWGD